ncbi:MAG: hypothetical protein KJZ86_07780 [Caldilineaceae bacterium]|nr:hypothetical protein [Caldilineaceae bacterium]
MAILISEREVASVPLLTVEVSGDEVITTIRCVKYMLENLDTDALESISGAYRDEVEGMLDDLLSMVDWTEREAASTPLFALAD